MFILTKCKQCMLYLLPFSGIAMFLWLFFVWLPMLACGQLG